MFTVYNLALIALIICANDGLQKLAPENKNSKILGLRHYNNVRREKNWCMPLEFFGEL